MAPKLNYKPADDHERREPRDFKLLLLLPGWLHVPLVEGTAAAFRRSIKTASANRNQSLTQNALVREAPPQFALFVDRSQRSTDSPSAVLPQASRRSGTEKQAILLCYRDCRSGTSSIRNGLPPASRHLRSSQLDGRLLPRP